MLNQLIFTNNMAKYQFTPINSSSPLEPFDKVLARQNDNANTVSNGSSGLDEFIGVN